MTSKEIREKYLEFFKSKGHVIIPSASLIPKDSTTLFVGSGMQPLVPYLLGKKHPKGTRLTNSQKCFRAEDIKEVGDNHHTTFFEMLGNWSLGDYFKKEQLSWYFEFLTKELKINPEKLYVTVFQGNKDIGIDKDSESVEIWKKLFKQVDIEAKDVDFAEKNGMKDGRIFYYDETKNWWSRSGVPKNMPVGEPGGPDSEVFYDLGVELKRHENSEYKDKVCHINCDCGRFIEIGNSVFMEYMRTEKGFEKLPQKNVDFGGGLERTAMVLQNKTSAFEIDVFEPIIKKIEKLSAKKYEDNVKAFEVIADHIRGVVFLASEGILPAKEDRGAVIKRLIRDSFKMGELINMPANFLTPLAKLVIDNYKDCYPEVKSNQSNILEIIKNEEKEFVKTEEKSGKKRLEELKLLKKSGKKLTAEKVFILHDTYGLSIDSTISIASKLNIETSPDIHKKIEELRKKHQEISRAGAEKKFGGVGKDVGYQATKLHTATHLLHQVLREVLGDHVKQMGSDITHERLRFDFSHPDKMTDEEIKKVEKIVNQKIKENLEVKKQEMNYSDAIKSGALAFFKEKYPEKVTVYSIDRFSKEICAGPHVKKTGELGSFKIIKEKSAAAGIRRIRAVIE